MAEKDFRVRKGLQVDGTGTSSIAGSLKVGTTSASTPLAVGGDITAERLNLDRTSGYSSIEVKGGDGAFIDLGNKDGTNDDFDARLITDGTGLDIIVTAASNHITLKTNNSQRLKVEDTAITMYPSTLQFTTTSAPTIKGGAHNPLTIYGNTDGTATSTTNNVVTRSTSAAIDFDVNASQQLSMRIKDNKDVDVYGVLSGPGIAKGGFGANSFNLGATGDLDGDGSADAADDWYEVFRWTPNHPMSATTSNQYRNFAARFQVVGRGNARTNFDMYVRGEYGVQDSTGWWAKEFIIDGLEETTDDDGNASPDADSIFKMCYNAGTSLSMPYASLYMRRDEHWELRTCNLISMFTNCVFEFKDSNVGETTPTNDGETGSADLSPSIRRKLRVDANNQLINGVGATGIYFDDANDRLGIGNASPSAPLTITADTDGGDTVRIEGSDANGNLTTPDLTLIRTNGSPGGNTWLGHLHFKGKNNASGTNEEIAYASIAGQIDGGADGSEKGRLKFFTYASGTNTLSMTIDESKVGIGIAEPATKLHVADAAEVTLSVDSSHATGAQISLDSTGTGGNEWRIVSGADNAGIGGGAFGLYNVDTTSYRFNVTSAGNVGIGDTSPHGKLEVHGTTRLDPTGTYAAAVSSGSGTDTSTTAAIATIGAANWFHESNGYLRNIIGHDNSGKITIGQSGTSMWNTIDLIPGHSGKIRLYSDDPDTSTQHLTVTVDDKMVGIGTASPGHTLDVQPGTTVGVGLNVQNMMQDVNGRPNHNLVPSHQWTIGTGSIGNFTQNGSTSENERVWGNGPRQDANGGRQILWKMTNQDTGGGDGGFNTSMFPIDHTKMYRWTVWAKQMSPQSGAGSMSMYMGMNGYDSSGSNLGVLASGGTGTANGNPYFWSGDLPIADKWYLIVGYCQGSGDDATGSHGSGVYDPVTGKKVISGNTFTFQTTHTHARHRAYLFYYDTVDSDADGYFWCPTVECCDGNETPLSTLLGHGSSSSPGYFYSTDSETVVEIANNNANANADAKLRLTSMHGSDSWIEFISDTYGQLEITGGGSTRRPIITMDEPDTDSSGIFNINKDHYDWDTKIFGDSTTPVIYVDGTNNRMGVGTTSPSVPLEVDGEIKGSKINLSSGTDAFTIQSSNPAREKKIYATTSGDGSPFDEMVYHSEGSTGGWSGQHTFTVSKSEDDDPDVFSPYTAFRIRDSGNGTSSEVLVSHKLGVGILDPVPMLHIYGNNATTNQTTSGAASITIEQDGTGDAALNFLLTGTRRWIMGIDNSLSDKFVLSTGGTDLNTGAKLTVDTSGNLTMAGGVNGTSASFTGSLAVSNGAVINGSHTFLNATAITQNGAAINGTNFTKCLAAANTYAFSNSYLLVSGLTNGSEMELFRFNVTNSGYRTFQAGKMYIRVQDTATSGFFQQTVTFGDTGGDVFSSTTDRLDSAMGGVQAAWSDEKATIVVSKVSDYICVKFKNETGSTIATSGFSARLSCELFEMDAMPS